MDKRFAKHKHYTSRKFKPSDKTMNFREHFRVTHYAGEVTYSVKGFVDKNKDTLYQDLKRLMFNRCVACPYTGAATTRSALAVVRW